MKEFVKKYWVMLYAVLGLIAGWQAWEFNKRYKADKAELAKMEAEERQAIAKRQRIERERAEKMELPPETGVGAP